MMNKLNKTTLAIAVAMGTVASTNAAVIIFEDDFSTNTLAAAYDSQATAYNVAAESVTVARSTSGAEPFNFIQVKDAFTLDSYTSTELTVAFDFAFGGSMFGSGFAVQYNDGGGVMGWQTIFTEGYNSTNTSDTVASNPLTVTITEGATYAFTDTAKVRFVSTQNTGSKGYTFDNIEVSVDVVAVPEPSSAALLGLGGLALILLRRK